jgi:tRNA1(Val) A37 N6-methylase TrmN6
MPEQVENEIASAEELTSGTLLDGKIRFRQPAAGYRTAIDAVLLAAAVPAGARDVVLDAGTGAGAALLCLAARVPECRIVGVERDEELAGIARDNVAENGFAGRAEIVEGDIARPPLALAAGSFDHVMMNPPYLERERARLPADAKRRAAMVEDETGLAEWVGFARRMLRDRGTLTLIHRADRIDRLMAELAPSFGGIAIFPLWPARDRPAKRVLLRARKSSAEPAALLPGLVLHDAEGRFTPEAEAVLRGGGGLDFS